MIKQDIRITFHFTSMLHASKRVLVLSHFLHILAQIVDLMYTRNTLQKLRKPVLDQIVKRWAKKGSCPGGEMSLE